MIKSQELKPSFKRDAMSPDAVPMSNNLVQSTARRMMFMSPTHKDELAEPSYKDSLTKAKGVYSPRDKAALSKSAFYKLNPGSSDDGADLDSNQVLSDNGRYGRNKNESPTPTKSLL